MVIEKTVDVYVNLDDILDQISDSEFDSIIKGVDANTLIEELRLKKLDNKQCSDLIKIANKNCISVVRNKFEGSRNGALEVLQDLLGMQHTVSKEQVIEQLKQIL